MNNKTSKMMMIQMTTKMKVGTYVTVVAKMIIMIRIKTKNKKTRIIKKKNN